MRSDSAADSGTWDKLTFASEKGDTAKQNLIRAALFGDGTQDNALIARVLTGKTDGNYRNMKAVFDKLGIPTGNDNIDHFHIYLRPPEMLGISGMPSNNLLANGVPALQSGSSNSPTLLEPNVQGLLNYTQSVIETGDELMFAINIPYVPVQETSIVLAEATISRTSPNTLTADGNQKPDYILNDCQEFTNHMDPSSAEHSIDPAGQLSNYYYDNYKRQIDDNAIRASILVEPKYGEMVERVDTTGHRAYSYNPNPGFLGTDTVVFQAEYGGKRYKIVMKLIVTTTILGNDPLCSKPRLIKVGNQSIPDVLRGDSGDVTVSISPLDGTAVGQTTGEGVSAQITLDSNAAGHSWYIDSTPDTNEEYLPTADAHIWQARAGSLAAGKMDMLSVLLHEYGHALGIEHSTDGRDFMAPNLQAGERRLPTADELALMSQLVAALKAQQDSSTADYADSPQPLPRPYDPSLPLGGGFAFLALGRVRRTDYGWSLNLADGQNILAPAPAQFQTAINSTLGQNAND